MSGRMTGATLEMWVSVRSLTSSLRTLTAPWTANSWSALTASIRMSNRPGQASGQSQ